MLAWILTAPAAQVEGTRVPCPGGEGEVVVNRLIAQNTVGGWDSDGARYSGGGNFRDQAVSTCASGLSLLGADMARGLSPAMLAKVEPVLQEIRAEHPGEDLTALPAHQRHAFAARIYSVLDQPEKEVQLWLSASWLARDQGVGLFKGLDGPVMARLMLAAGDRQLKNELAPATRKQLTFNLAVVATRGGYPALRNDYLDQVEAMELTPEEAERVQALRRAIPLEAAYQDKAIKALSRTLIQRHGAPRVTATYQLADLLRRRGQADRALGYYQIVANSDEVPQELTELAAYFVAELGGGEPWENRRFQKIGGLQAPEP